MLEVSCCYNCELKSPKAKSLYFSKVTIDFNLIHKYLLGPYSLEEWPRVGAVLSNQTLLWLLPTSQPRVTLSYAYNYKQLQLQQTFFIINTLKRTYVRSLLCCCQHVTSVGYVVEKLLPVTVAEAKQIEIECVIKQLEHYETTIAMITVWKIFYM